MGGRVTLALAVSVLVVGLYAWIGPSPDGDAPLPAFLGEQRAAPAPQEVERLLFFDPGAITAIGLKRDAAEARAQRSGGTWGGVARPQLLDDFLRNLQEAAEIMPLDVRAEELADYGLNPPAGVIELFRGDEPVIVVLLGHRNPPATSVYVQIGRGGRVVLTGALILWEFEKAFTAMTDTGA